MPPKYQAWTLVLSYYCNRGCCESFYKLFLNKEMR